jgi:hypothetical protein
MKKLIFAAGVLIGLCATAALTASAVTLPHGAAIFETSLQSRISSTDTSMTLVSTSTSSGEALQSGYQCFTIDEGRTDAEYVCGTLTSARTVTGLERGLSYLTGTTTVSANQHAHRVGANVKITDFPLIQRLRNQLNGAEIIPNGLVITGTSTVSTDCSTLSGNTQICAKGYIDTRVSAGAANSNESTAGLVELATPNEAASSTLLGSTGARLVLGANLATTSCQIATTSVLVASSTTGKLDGGCFNAGYSYAFTGTNTFSSATTTFNATTSIAASASNKLVLNGVPYSFPSTAMASGTYMTTNGSGTVVGMRPDFGLISSTTISSVASTTISNIPAVSDLTVYIDIPAASQVATEEVSIQFNTDTSADYSWLVTNDAGTRYGAQSKNVAVVNSPAGIANVGQFIVLNITNRARFHSYLSRSQMVGDITNGSMSYGGGQWNGTAPINSITIGSTSNLPNGTAIRIYGSVQ